MVTIQEVDVPLYPAFLDVTGARCVVVGGGRVAARKAHALAVAGADVLVVAPQTGDEIEALAAASPHVRVTRKLFDERDLEGALLAVAATDDLAVNERVGRLARDRGVLVNVVDQPALSTFLVPAAVSHGRLQVAVSTGGASPAFARRLRERLEEQLSPRLAAYLDAMAEIRSMVFEQVKDSAARAAIFEALAADDVVETYVGSEPDEANRMLHERARELIARSGGAA
jgi:precorrin-2 dehydrogenase/sirohydrochlorin ferrochelatase